MVGRPCGQFQGLSRPPRWDTILLIVFISNALPIMMELRQARIASIALTLKQIADITSQPVHNLYKSVQGFACQ